MATLNATVGDPAMNSYVTRAEAMDILTTRRLHSDFWLTLSTSKQDAALMWASRLLDQAIDWGGSIRVLGQAMRWPRSGLQDYDGQWVNYDTIPTLLKEAVCDLALALAQRDRVSDPDLLGLGFSSARVGPLSVTIDPKMVLRLIPDFILGTLTLWGDIISPVGGMKTHKLVRD